MLSAFVTGLAGLELAPVEIAFLRAARPCGAILFARNVATPEQLRRLTGSVAEAVGEEILVLIDQEGGRVRGSGRRIGAPFPRPPPMTRRSAAISAGPSRRRVRRPG